MIQATHTFVLPVPPVDAFAILSHPAREPEWLTACRQTKLLDGPPAPGRRYEITFEFLSRVMDFLIRIDTYEPGRQSQFTTLSGPFHSVGGYRYHSLPDGATEVRWWYDVEPGEFFGLTPDSLVRKFLISQVEKDAAALGARLASEKERE